MGQKVITISPESTDGHISKQENNWAGTRDATTGTAGTELTVECDFLGGDYLIRRVAVGWDTSVLPANAIVLSWKIILNASIGGLGNDDGGEIHAVPTTWSAGDALASGNFNDLTFTTKGNISTASLGNDVEIDISDNSIINLSDYSEVFLIFSRDLNNSAPTGFNQFSLSNIRAEITYKVPDIGNPLFFPSGGGLGIG